MVPISLSDPRANVTLLYALTLGDGGRAVIVRISQTEGGAEK